MSADLPGMAYRVILPSARGARKRLREDELLSPFSFVNPNQLSDASLGIQHSNTCSIISKYNSELSANDTISIEKVEEVHREVHDGRDSSNLVHHKAAAPLSGNITRRSPSQQGWLFTVLNKETRTATYGPVTAAPRINPWCSLPDEDILDADMTARIRNDISSQVEITTVNPRDLIRDDLFSAADLRIDDNSEKEPVFRRSQRKPAKRSKKPSSASKAPVHNTTTRTCGPVGVATSAGQIGASSVQSRSQRKRKITRTSPSRETQPHSQFLTLGDASSVAGSASTDGQRAETSAILGLPQSFDPLSPCPASGLLQSQPPAIVSPRYATSYAIPSLTFVWSHSPAIQALPEQLQIYLLTALARGTGDLPPMSAASLNQTPVVDQETLDITPSNNTTALPSMSDPRLDTLYYHSSDEQLRAASASLPIGLESTRRDIALGSASGDVWSPNRTTTIGGDVKSTGKLNADDIDSIMHQTYTFDFSTTI
ncbi:hypothetical protein EV360DRAFT_90853 [Lentinula raphanica]|nr:hypothetical protein EV360DRAFT_90853 [Lentinula raphanica]